MGLLFVAKWSVLQIEFHQLACWTDVPPVIWCRSKQSELCVYMQVCRCPGKCYCGAELCFLIPLFDVLLPRWGRWACASVVLCSSFLFPLVLLTWTHCYAWKDSAAALSVGNPVEHPEELSHQFPTPLTAFVRPFHFWMIVCVHLFVPLTEMCVQRTCFNVSRQVCWSCSERKKWMSSG